MLPSHCRAVRGNEAVIATPKRPREHPTPAAVCYGLYPYFMRGWQDMLT